MIRTPNLNDVSTVAGIVTDALLHTRLAAWLVTDPADRRAVILAWSRMQVGYAVAHHAVDMFDDGTAAVVRLHPELDGPSAFEYRERLAAICGPHLQRFLTLDRLFELHHPAGPRHHLRFLAARPEWHYLGRGNVLLDHHHLLLDAGGMPASFEVNGTVAQHHDPRHGHRAGPPIGDPQGLHCRLMWRPPAAHRSALVAR